MRVKNNQNSRRLYLGLGLLAGMSAAAAWLVRRAQTSAAYRPQSGRAERPALAVVTGASSGIGAEYARLLAEHGYDLFLVARRGQRLEELAEELRRRHSVKVETLAVDLSQPESIAMMEARLKEMPDLEILVNNAGFGTYGRFEEVDFKSQVDMINLHVLASVRLARAALPAMTARQRGAIVNVASLAGFIPLVGNATYSATKSYLITFSEALDLELRGSGVRVQALCPGMTRSEFHSREMLSSLNRNMIPGFMWMSSKEVAEASFEALPGGKVVFVPGFVNRVLSFIERSELLSPFIKEGSLIVLSNHNT
jgi:short-subunit dehydrogenase